MVDINSSPNKASQLLREVEASRVSLVDQLVGLDRCSHDKYYAAISGVLLSCLRLARTNKAAVVALREIENNRNTAKPD
jgi:hypothetical protein